MSVTRIILISLFVLLLAGGSVGGGLWFEYERFKQTAIDLPDDEWLFEVPRGASIRKVVRRLTDAGVVDHPYYLLALAYETGAASRLKAGEFALKSGGTPANLLKALTDGPVVQYRFTIVEGWTFRDAVTALSADDQFENNLVGLTDQEIMVRLGHPDEHPEGRFFPDTYLFPRGATDLDVLRRAYQRLQEVLNQEWEQREDGLPLKTPYEALILASIIEKETGLASERPQIAGVFIRRLRQGMKLQTDPTVIYGMGESFDGDIRRADLSADTPYNTYVHFGLTPTPIALVGREAIKAAVNPADGDALYFVATGDGGHYFSPTLTEHNRAVHKYQLGEDEDL